MTINQAAAKLQDKTFLLGGFRRKEALKCLAENPDPKAAEILIDAFDKSNPDEKSILDALFSAPGINDLMPCNNPDARRIRDVLFSTSSQKWIDRMWHIWAGSRQEWLGNLLVKKGIAFKGEGQERVVSMLKLGWKSRGLDIITETPFTKKNASEMLCFAADKDKAIQAGAIDYIASLPVKQEWNDIIVDEWIRSESPSIEKIIIDQGRLPSSPAREALLFLVTGRVKAYKEMKDEDGLLFMEALAMASQSMRQRINTVVQESKDSLLAGAYLKASKGIKGLDSDLGLRALMASGNEDGLVDAAEKLDTSKLLELCERWAKNGRRPNDRKKAGAVERALAAYKRAGTFEVEEASPPPDGMQDIFQAWSSSKLKDEDIKKDIGSDDPFLRARGIFLGGRKGTVDQKALLSKAGGKDWPERFIAALFAIDASLKSDHCHWVKACSGFDAELLSAKVECGPDEYERCETIKETLRKGNGPVAARSLAILDVVQSFRALFIGGMIIVRADDSGKMGDVSLTKEKISRDELSF